MMTVLALPVVLQSHEKSDRLCLIQEIASIAKDGGELSSIWRTLFSLWVEKLANVVVRTSALSAHQIDRKEKPCHVSCF